MKVIIIGCGKVGMSLARQLYKEHDLTLIDRRTDRINAVPEDIDAMTIVGDGANVTVQDEAGMSEADLVIAVTDSDELNLLCCLIAQKTAAGCHTIARVRNPVYSQQLPFIKERLGISMTINPEYAAALEVSRLLRFPSAISIETFARGRVELLRFKARPEHGLAGLRLTDLHARFRSDVLVCGIQRGDEVHIPDGQFALQDGDLISLIATPQAAAQFFSAIGLSTNQVKSALLVGGGRMGLYLAQMLLAMKIDVRIIEKDLKRCELLSELLPAASIICGDGTSKELLLSEGLSAAEAFVAMTNLDEENILLSLYAKQHTKGKLITKVTRMDFDNIIDELDIGSVIYPKSITTDYILQYVRSMQNSIGSSVETLYRILDEKAEALEFTIREGCEVAGIPLKDLETRDNLLIGCINRHGKIIVPRGHDTIEVGDTVIVVTTHAGLQDVKDILK
ncbi:MAG: Trk system potassium transporter TrkA [Lachnospiraceae bacterium]|nr:Trk system potassium transporter TrkA [Lachnospiraceae bacterium]